jgi:hypothetical protein
VDYSNKHYYRTNEYGIVIAAFSDAFEKPDEGDFLFEEGGRHFNPTIRNRDGQCLYKIVDDWVASRSTEELEAELAARPPEPPTIDEKIGELETESVGTMLALTEVYETNAAQDAQQDLESVDSMLAITEVYELVMSLQTRVNELEAQLGGTP